MLKSDFDIFISMKSMNDLFNHIIKIFRAFFSDFESCMKTISYSEIFK
nr:MAG TPA: hypothetical protein [Caudoviricetes sp.]